MLISFFVFTIPSFFCLTPFCPLFSFSRPFLFHSFRSSLFILLLLLEINSLLLLFSHTNFFLVFTYFPFSYSFLSFPSLGLHLFLSFPFFFLILRPHTYPYPPPEYPTCHLDTLDTLIPIPVPNLG